MRTQAFSLLRRTGPIVQALGTTALMLASFLSLAPEGAAQYSVFSLITTAVSGFMFNGALEQGRSGGYNITSRNAVIGMIVSATILSGIISYLISAEGSKHSVLMLLATALGTMLMCLEGVYSAHAHNNLPRTSSLLSFSRWSVGATRILGALAMVTMHAVWVAVAANLLGLIIACSAFQLRMPLVGGKHGRSTLLKSLLSGLPGSVLVNAFPVIMVSGLGTLERTIYATFLPVLEIPTILLRGVREEIVAIGDPDAGPFKHAAKFVPAMLIAWTLAMTFLLLGIHLRLLPGIFDTLSASIIVLWSGGILKALYYVWSIVFVWDQRYDLQIIVSGSMLLALIVANSTAVTPQTALSAFQAHLFSWFLGIVALGIYSFRGTRELANEK